MQSAFSKWLLEWLVEGMGISPELAIYFRLLIFLAILVLLCFLVWYVSRRFIISLIKRLTKRTETDWDDIMLERKVFNDLAHILPLLVIQLYTRYVLKDFESWAPLVERITETLMVLVLLKVMLRFLNAVQDILLKQDKFKDKPVTSFIQVGKILAIILFGVVALSFMLSKSPAYFLSAMGAASAVIIFIFKDSIMALIASVQLMANDLLRVGDWVGVPKYNADGIVIRINLSTVLVQNWDHTHSSVPPQIFITDSFINYRGMLESGGRRIMRSLNIKVNSVRFCEEAELERFRKMEHLKPYFEEAENSENLQQPTNLELFRAYAEAHAKQHPGINTELLCLVRQLQATPEGIPLQLYAFTFEKKLIFHAQVISDIFSHLIAMAHEFGLEVFETPSGSDLREYLDSKASEQAT